MRKPNEFTRILQVGMMLVLPVGLASCAPDDGDEMETPEEATLPDTDVDAVEPVTVDINSIGESEVEGEATISRVGESLMVSLQLEELMGTGPFRAQILSGRCEERTDMMGSGRATTGTDTAAGTTPSTPQTPGATQQGQVLATLEPIQVSGATTPPAGGQTAEQAQAGMSHSTIPVAGLGSAQQAFIEVQGQGARAIACGNIDNLNQLLTAAGATGVAPMTPPPGTNPSGTPGSRP